jgi:CheY-like chemotaxis protein
VLHPLEAAYNRSANVTILVADDEPSLRSLLAVRLSSSVAVEVLQAVDGAEAVQLGLQQHPQIALLDVSMPRLGGIEAALTLRSLRPVMKIALQSADAEEHRARAAAVGLLLFDKRDLDQPLTWVKACARAIMMRPSTREQRCSRCDYRIACLTTPACCPMCQTCNPWVPMPTQRHQAVGLERRT